MQTQKRSSSDDHLVEGFRALAEKLADFGNDARVSIKPYRDPSLPHFSKLNALKKRESLNNLQTYVEICEDTIRNGYDLSSLQIVWHALKKFSLRAPFNLFENIKETDVIEIHNLEGIQIFRNFNFYSFCSYTIEELYSSSWDYLYEHGDSALATLTQFVSDCASGEWSGPRPLDIPEYSIKENYSEGKFNLLVQMKVGSPLFAADKKPAATIITSDGALESFITIPEEISARPNLTLV